MDCTLCYLRFSVISELKKHYVDFHGVDESNPHFLELFKPVLWTENAKNAVLYLIVAE